MTLQQLYYFQKIAKLQHYNKAAKELHVAQPSLSKSMALLEEELQVPLFEKQGRNIVLTKYGRIFLGYVDSILADIERAKKDVQGMLDRKTGHINIAYVSPFGNQYIPKIVRTFLQREENAKVTFSFREGFTESMIRAIHENEADVIFGSYEMDEPDLDFTRVLREPVVLIGPPDMKFPKEKKPLKEFEGYSFIFYNKASSMGKYTRKFFQKSGIRMNSICESTDEISILALVANGFGISYVAETNEVRAAIENGKVQQIPIEEENYRSLYMMYDKNKFHAPAVLDFIQFIKDGYSV